MNGDNQIENKLNELFAKAKQQEPLLTNEEVHTLISHAPTSAFPGKQLVQFFNNHLKIIIMSTIVSSILISLFLLYNQQNTGKPGLSKTIKSQIQINGNLNCTEKEKRIKHSEFVCTVVIKPTNNLLNSVEVKKDKDSCNETFVKLYGDEYIMSLTFEEFCKLGFLYDDKIWYYYNLSPDSVVTGFDVTINKSLYSSINNSAVRFASHNKPLTRYDFYPVCFTKRYNASEKEVLSQNVKSFRMILKEDSAYVKRQLMRIPHPFTEKDSASIILLSYKEDYLDLSKFDIANDTLVPIVLKVDDSDTLSPYYKIVKRGGQDFSEKIFWFKTSKSFYDKLPERYNSSIKQFYENVKALKKRIPCKNMDFVTYFSIDQLRNNLSSVNKIVLTNNELKRLGFTFDSTSIKFGQITDSFFYDIYINKITICGTSSSFSSDFLKNTSIQLPYGVRKICDFKKQKDYYLQFISDLSGIQSLKWRFDKPFNEKYFTDKYFLENINRLIPIWVKADSLKNCLVKDYIFWFTPTEVLFDSLPPRYSNDLRNEYKALLIHSDPNISQEIKDKTPTYCTYFEECRPTYPEISKLKVYPNPAKDIVNIEFELDKTDKVRIILFDIEGKPLKILKDSEEVPSGFNQLQVNMANMPDGIYILTIQNNYGKYKTQRIIKQ